MGNSQEREGKKKTSRKLGIGYTECCVYYLLDLSRKKSHKKNWTWMWTWIYKKKQYSRAIVTKKKGSRKGKEKVGVDEKGKNRMKKKYWNRERVYNLQLAFVQ